MTHKTLASNNFQEFLNTELIGKEMTEEDKNHLSNSSNHKVVNITSIKDVYESNINCILVHLSGPISIYSSISNIEVNFANKISKQFTILNDLVTSSNKNYEKEG